MWRSQRGKIDTVGAPRAPSAGRVHSGIVHPFVVTNPWATTKRHARSTAPDQSGDARDELEEESFGSRTAFSSGFDFGQTSQHLCRSWVQTPPAADGERVILNRCLVELVLVRPDAGALSLIHSDKTIETGSSGRWADNADIHSC